MFDLIKTLAYRKGKSINDVEDDLGLSKNTLYGLKKNTPSTERLQMLADYFNVSTDYLLGRTDWQKFDESLGEENLLNIRQSVDDVEQLTQFFRVDVSDLSESEKVEFEEEMKAMSEFIAKRIRLRRQKGGE